MSYFTTLPPGRYAILLRKSREDEEAERRGRYETLIHHEQMLLRLADQQGVTIAPEDIYRELASGESLNECPVCLSVLQTVMRGAYAGVFVREPSRLTRGDLSDMGKVIAAFQFSNTLVVTPRQVYDLSNPCHLRAFENDLMDGHRELGWIKDRMRDGKLQRIHEGQYLAAFAPWGWRKVTLPDKRKTLEPDANNDLGVRWFREGLAGHITSVSGHCDDLNRRGIPSPTGGLWYGESWRRVMSNVAWKGCVMTGGRRVDVEMDDSFRQRKRIVYQEPTIIPGIHEGTVSEEDFDRFQILFGIRQAPRTHTDLTLRNPLAGLLVCADCGRIMRRRISKGNERYDHSPANRHECWQQGAPMHVVVEEVIEALREITRDFELYSESAIDMDAVTSRVADLQKAIDECDKGVTNLMRLAQKGLITDDEFAEQRRRIDARKKDLKGQLAIAEKEADAVMTAEERTLRLHEAIDALGSPDATPEQQNNALKLIVKRIDYAKSKADGLSLKVFLR